MIVFFRLCEFLHEWYVNHRAVNSSSGNSALPAIFPTSTQLHEYSQRSQLQQSEIGNQQGNQMNSGDSATVRNGGGGTAKANPRPNSVEICEYRNRKRPRRFEKPLLNEEENVHDLSCRVCLDNRIDSLVFPCAHASYCMRCCSQLQKCGICRSEIQHRIRFFIV